MPNTFPLKVINCSHLQHSLYQSYNEKHHAHTLLHQPSEFLIIKGSNPLYITEKESTTQNNEEYKLKTTGTNFYLPRTSYILHTLSITVNNTQEK